MADTITDIPISNVEYVNVNTLSGLAAGTAVGLTNKGREWVSLIISPTQPAPDSLDGCTLCDLPNISATKNIKSGQSTIWAKAIGESPSKLGIQVNPETLGTDTSFEEGRRFRAFLDFTGLTLPLVLKFEIYEALDLTLSVQEIHDGALKYSVHSGGVEGGSFATVVPTLRVNNKAGVPIIPSGVNLSYGGTLNTASNPPIDVAYLRSSGASGQTSTVASDSTERRGFPPTTAYVKLEQVSGSNKRPEGVVRYEWTVA